MYLPCGPLLHSIAARNEEDDTWKLADRADVIFLLVPLVDFGAAMPLRGGEETFPLAGLDSVRTLKALDDMSKRGKFIWPHPTTVGFTAHKSVNTLLYGESIAAAGGVAEAPLLVHSLRVGNYLLERGSHVIKGDWSAERQSVVMPRSALNKSGRGVRVEEESRILHFAQLWKKAEELRGHPFAPRFFAVPYNDAMISLGEVRVYFANGKIVEMLHTIPDPFEPNCWGVERVSAARTAPIKNIK